MKKFTLIILASLAFSGLFAQELSIELGSIPATSVEQCTGTIWVKTTGGIPPYTFYWDDAITSSYRVDLCLGTYSVTVTDAASATATASIEFSTSSQIIIPLYGSETLSPSLYGQCDGTVMVSPYGGVAPYSYEIYDSITGLLISESNVALNLCAGEYYVVATDVNGGVYFHPFTISEEFIRLTTLQFPGAYPMNQPISIIVAGEPPFTVEIKNPINNTQTYTVENTTEQISYTPTYPGNHEIKIMYYNFLNPDLETFCAYDEMNIMNLPVTNAVNGCDGSVMTSNQINISMNYETSPSSFQTIFVENGTLCPGMYMVMVQDMMCPNVMNMTQIMVSGPLFDYPQLSVSSSNTIYNICTGMAWVEVEGGTTPYQYKWLDYPSNTTDFINDLCGGSLFVKVTDANNVWSMGYTYIASDLPETVPGDTLSASQNACIENITDSYIQSYIVNTSNVIVTWAIEHEGITTFIEVTYDYIITLPGTYNVELILTCQGGKSIVYLITELDISLTGININKTNDINIYPNPATDILNISLNENVKSLEITTITGSVISSFNANSNQMTFNVSDLSEGVYMIRFTNYDGSTVIKKFVK